MLEKPALARSEAGKELDVRSLGRVFSCRGGGGGGGCGCREGEGVGGRSIGEVFEERPGTWPESVEVSKERTFEAGFEADFEDVVEEVLVTLPEEVKT